MCNIAKTWIVPVLCLDVIAVPAAAAIIWTNSVDPQDPDRLSRMAWFDSANPGDIHWDGPTGLPFLLDGLDFGDHHTLYGVMDRDFYTINQQTGHANHIGRAWPLDPNDGGIFMDLSWDPVTRQMYGAYACAPDQGALEARLYHIDLETAHVTPVGTVYYVLEQSILPPGGLATSRDGVRYIDNMDGWVWELGEPERQTGPQIPAERKWRERNPNGVWFANVFGGMTIDWSRNGILYHVAWNLNTDQTEFWTVNPTTGIANREYTFGRNIYMLSAAIDFLPEPSSLHALVLPSIAMCCRRRR